MGEARRCRMTAQNNPAIALGDPMLDVGNFLAHLRWSANVWQEMAIFAMDLRLTAMHSQINKPSANIQFIEDILQGDDEITETCSMKNAVCPQSPGY